MELTGPFQQVVTLENLSLRGALKDEQLPILKDAGILTGDGKIIAVGDFEKLIKQYPKAVKNVQTGTKIALPGFVDSHTHICFAGNRANDFAMRNGGKTYLEIAQSGGGIWSSVTHTREASEEQLLSDLLLRIEYLLKLGITTIEIKSGYGLNLESELKMLRVIQSAQQKTVATLVPTCLSAHMKPRDYNGSNEEYLHLILSEILPQIKKENLAKRVDIFIEKTAFQPEESKRFLLKAKAMGFDLTAHVDQFTSGSSRIAVEVGAVSADHLEATNSKDIDYLSHSETVATALPGASLGLGEPFAPARKILDANGILAIGSDWNPGSAPMGNLITQASILATYQKLSSAEVLAGITYRPAHALRLHDRGVLKSGFKADFIVYDTDNFQNVIYRQGALTPTAVYVDGKRI